MDAVNAVVHIAAAAGFVVMCIWALHNQRNSRVLLRVARWDNKTDACPKQLLGNFSEYLSALCLLRGIALQGGPSLRFPMGVFIFESWIQNLRVERIKSINCQYIQKRWLIEINLQQPEILGEAERKSLATSICRLKMVEIKFT